jgi:hypothetical protein
MIFLDPDLNDLSKTIYLKEYHRYWLGQWGGEKNPKHDIWCDRIRMLKKRNPEAIQIFYDELAPLLGAGFAVAVVPSHDPLNISSGIRTLARRIAAAHALREDATACLVRKKLVPQKASNRGFRDVRIDLDSIEVEQKSKIRGTDILLLDDVMVTGRSLAACTRLLLEMGANSVQACIMGYRVRA